MLATRCIAGQHAAHGPARMADATRHCRGVERHLAAPAGGRTLGCPDQPGHERTDALPLRHTTTLNRAPVLRSAKALPSNATLSNSPGTPFQAGQAPALRRRVPSAAMYRSATVLHPLLIRLILGARFVALR